MHISVGTGIQNPGFGLSKFRGDMGMRQVEQDLSSLFLPKFMPYLMIFQSRACRRHCEILKNHQKFQKFGKK